MIRLLQRLLDPAYLYAIDPGPLGRWKLVYITWAIALGIGGSAAMWRVRRARLHPVAQRSGPVWRGTNGPVWRGRRSPVLLGESPVTIWACGLGLAFLSLRFLPSWAGHLPSHTRFLLFDVWTARVWPVSATLVAALAPIVGLLSRRRLPQILQCQIDALVGALQPQNVSLTLWQSAVLGLVHLIGLAWLWYAADRPIWWAIPSLTALSILPLAVRLPQQNGGSATAPDRASRLYRFRPETLAPLLPAYVGSAIFFLAQRLDIRVVEYQSFAFPDPLSPWINVPVLLVAGVAYTLWIQTRLITQRRQDWILPILVCLVVALWLLGTVAVHRTHGVTASDPYCYVQMAVDLAETGSPLHDFPLAGLARELGLPTWPTVHFGYHPPPGGDFQPPFGDLRPPLENRSPTMWSIGWPLLMVPFYWVGGLEALYYAAPLMGVLALIVTWLTVNEALHRETRAVRWAVAALTCLMVATSPEGSERILVPMADSAAQLFTMLTLWLLLRGRRGRAVFHGLLAGASFGAAYFVRHPQLSLGVAALVATWPFVPPKRTGDLRPRQTGPVRPETTCWLSKRRLALLVAFGLAAFVVAVPDLLYHRSAFGKWFHTESTEWDLIAIRNITSSLFSVLPQGLLRREELGFIAPFAVYGGILLWRKHRFPALILGTGFVAVFLFHLCYAALRPRDLIAILPVLYLCAAYGFIAVWQSARQRRTAATALLLICCAVFLSARSYRSLEMLWQDDVITFGYISASQRQGLETLRTITPDDAVIGSMLNGGAIELYADRQAVHPAPWKEQELHTWVDALLSRGRPFYILDDGEEMGPILARLKVRYVVRPVQALDLPYFALGGGNLPRSTFLYRVERGH